MVHPPGGFGGAAPGQRSGVTLLVGTSGWQYKDWRDPFYRRAAAAAVAGGLRRAVRHGRGQQRLLPAARAVDLREVVRAGAAGFVVAVKASRYLTHIKRLKEPGEPVARLLDRAARRSATGSGRSCSSSRPRCGPRPTSSTPVSASSRRDVRVAVEPRHESWWSTRCAPVLRAHGRGARAGPTGVAGRHPAVGDGGLGLPAAPRGRRRPVADATAARRWRPGSTAWPTPSARGDAYAYFNNDQHAAAPATPPTWCDLAEAPGLDVAHARAPT